MRTELKQFKPVPLSRIPRIQRTGRPAIVKALPIFKEFERLITNDVPFEALIFDTTEIKSKKQGGPLKSPKQTLMSAFRKEIRARHLKRKYTVFLRGNNLYLVDTKTFQHLRAA